MSSKEKVSKQVGIAKGDSAIIFELTKRGLVIELTEKGKDTLEHTIGKRGMDALRELLGLQQPLLNKPAENTPVVPLEEVAKRFTREGDDAPDRPGVPVEGSGLIRGADKTESGMD